MYGRRTFLHGVAAAAATATVTKAMVSMQDAPSAGLPRLGVVTSVTPTITPDQAIGRVRQLGFTGCQLGVGSAPAELANPIRDASSKYGVEITALMTLGTGRMVWTLQEGPQTIGIIPRATRKSRIEALKRASILAKACGVKAVHTHCGFIPEDPNDSLYAEAVSAIKEIVSFCRENGQTFLCETGQETPITLLRAINDVALDNIGVNLDLANLILYGKGEPLGALDVLGKHVRGVHAKDGLYPADPYGLGEETPIGKGKVRFPEVVAQLSQLSYTGPITIEREISGPGQEKDIRASSQYLTELIERQYRSASRS